MESSTKVRSTERLIVRSCSEAMSWSWWWIFFLPAVIYQLNSVPMTKNSVRQLHANDVRAQSTAKIRVHSFGNDIANAEHCSKYCNAFFDCGFE